MPRYVPNWPAKLALAPSSVTALDRTATRKAAPRPVRARSRSCAAPTASASQEGNG